MKRLVTFVFGVIVGAALLYGGLHFHIIRSAQGFHLVPKVQTTLADIYVDIRAYRPADWVKQNHVAEALVRADRAELIQSAVGDSLRETIDGLLTPRE